MDAVILFLLFVSSFVTQAVHGQDGDKVNTEGSGQSRAIYSPRQLSPHRMMHFGKRPAMFEPPTIMTAPRGYDLYPRRQQQQLRLLPERYPYMLSTELERGQTLQPVQPEEELQAHRNLMYTLERPQVEFAINSAEQQQQQLAANALAGQRFLKLISGESNAAADGNEDLANEKNPLVEQNSAEKAQSQEGQQQQRQPQSAISISTRSGRPNTFNLPKAYISTLLYGRQGSSPMPSFGNYKKAEPKENIFMHFGRK